jgi:sterol desaturase/sphingolipid hydroxylase (fatty acid hydroxylase superfamily)
MPSLIKEIILPVSGVMLANLCLILCFHVHAVAYTRENDTDESRNNAYNTTTTSSSSSSSLWWQFWSRIAQGGGPDALQPLDKILFGVVILLAFELLDFLTKSSGSTYLATNTTQYMVLFACLLPPLRGRVVCFGHTNTKIILGVTLWFFLFSCHAVWLHSKRIPVRGKHLDELSRKDLLFIGISKAQTAPFLYFYLRYAYFEPCMVWNLSQMSLGNTLLPLPFLFIMYDFIYTILHWALHLKIIYAYIHKHHHHQKAPSRANVDAVNVHPLEFFLGEYNHLLVLFLLCRVCQFITTTIMDTSLSSPPQIHVVSSILFLAIGGVLAGINHTRYDFVWTVAGIQLFDSKAHDVHHRIPQSNYGQYIMLWDRVFGTYR